ncbi:MAG TPA: DUF4231 domain-containing protein [Vicinamibacterales bacterium]
MTADGGLAHGGDHVMERLEDQIGWYDRKSALNQQRFKQLKTVVIVAAALIPVLTAFEMLAVRWITGGLGALITVLEGTLHLNQYQRNWIAYRSTCESLKHEKYLFLARAAHYTTANDPRTLLAERIESLVSQEHAKWASTDQQGTKQGTT